MIRFFKIKGKEGHTSQQRLKIWILQVVSKDKTSSQKILMQSLHISQ